VSAYRGIRIADFSQGVSGPMAAMLLGDFEAKVVKVEPPGGDRLKDHPGYQAWNRNKQVVTLDLDTPAGLAASRALIAGADVALFSEPPGRLETLGLDAATLAAAHPGLVHAWMPPYGVRGDWSNIPPHHSLLTALSGVAFRQGCYGDRPVHLVLPLLWYGQGVLGASAIGAALLERQRSGKGQAVTVSGLHGLSEVSGPVRVLDQPPLPRGAPLGASPSYRLYECADGQWFFLGALFANFYLKVFQALGIEEHWERLALDPCWPATPWPRSSAPGPVPNGCRSCRTTARPARRSARARPGSPATRWPRAAFGRSSSIRSWARWRFPARRPGSARHRLRSAASPSRSQRRPPGRHARRRSPAGRARRPRPWTASASSTSAP
jgi:hypothetical protein